MYIIICIVLDLIGFLGSGYALYKLFIEKEEIVAYHVWAYAFFILALASSMICDYFGMLLGECFAIYYFVKYVKMKEVE